jgi:hypothetical protein
VTNPDDKANWLRDILADVARRLRRPSVGSAPSAECASILKRILGDLRGPTSLEQPRTLVRSPRTRWWITIAMGFILYLLMKRLFGRDRNS